MSLVCDSNSVIPSATSNSSGIGGCHDRPNSPGSPIHSAPNLPTGAHILPVTHFHKKSRKKRKELDALVPEEKIRRKNSFSSVGAGSSLAADSDDTEGGRLGLLGKSSSSHGSGGVWGVVPGVLAIVVVVGTAVMAMAALRLLMVTRRDMETLTRRLGSVEARSSELPARFHEAHVRLQELQRNTSALWDALHALQNTVVQNQGLLSTIQTDVGHLQTSLQAAPQLSNLPLDVKALQSSVASFGSTLQDVQSAIKAVKDDQKQTRSKVDDMKVSLDVVANNTQLPSSRQQRSIGSVVSGLQLQLQEMEANVTQLTTSVCELKNATVEDIASVKAKQDDLSSSVSNLTMKVLSQHPADSLSSDDQQQLYGNFSDLKGVLSSLTAQVDSINSKLVLLSDTSGTHTSLLNELSQNVSVVKGVEKKLEGSQLQLASSVSDVKQQILSLQHKFSSLTTTTTSAAPPLGGDVTHNTASNTRKKRSGALLVPGEHLYEEEDSHRSL